jgi:hypothetical protein
MRQTIARIAFRSPRRSQRGLLTAEDAQMVAAIDEPVGRWAKRDGVVLDIAEETTDFALDVLERTVFSAGLLVGRDDLRAAMRT